MYFPDFIELSMFSCSILDFPQNCCFKLFISLISKFHVIELSYWRITVFFWWWYFSCSLEFCSFSIKVVIVQWLSCVWLFTTHSLWWTVNGAARFMVSKGELLTLDQKESQSLRALCRFKVKVTEKASDIDIRRGQESTRLTSLSGTLYTSQLATENRLKNTSRLWEFCPDPFP